MFKEVGIGVGSLGSVTEFGRTISTSEEEEAEVVVDVLMVGRRLKSCGGTAAASCC